MRKPSDKNLSARGYRYVFVKIDGKQRNIYAHRIVAFKIFGPIGELMQVNHIDGDKTNNSPSNLELMTPRQNLKHSFECLGRRQTIARGEKASRSKLTSEAVLEIRRRLSMGEASTKLAKEFGVSNPSISGIKARKTWSHI
jgi:hypothetical protein